ncbi:MAG TPA: nitric oxide reductase [Lutibacter sp.]|nr:nitric oxide reductase [Lutibacter sp.]
MSTAKIDYKNIYYPPGGILIWILIFLELITFSAALIALAVYSRENPAAYHSSRLLLNSTYGAINTLFLLTSGFFMATSMHQLKAGNYDKSTFYLKLTMLGGVLFLILKAIEYSGKISHGLTIGYDTFFTFYWLLTLFHVIHVLVGMIILVSMYFSIKKKKENTSIEDAEAGATFWHMCDLIWLILFPVLYLIF